jgi:hypothetical protein
LFGAGTPTRVIGPTIENDNKSVVDRIEMKYDKVLQGMALSDFVALLWGTLFFSGTLRNDCRRGGIRLVFHATGRPRIRTLVLVFGNAKFLQILEIPHRVADYNHL